MVAAGKTRQLISRLARCFTHSLLNFVLWLLVSNIYFMLIQDTFRGRVCECPVVNGVQFKGDGYSSCVGTSTRSSCSFIMHFT